MGRHRRGTPRGPTWLPKWRPRGRLGRLLGGKYAPYVAGVAVVGLILGALWLFDVGPFGGGGGEAAGSSGSETSPVPTIPPSGATIDSCLVGRWHSEDVGSTIHGATGLSDVVLTFEADGTETVDYSESKPEVETHATSAGPLTITSTWRGVVVADVSTVKGFAAIDRLESSTATLTIDNPGNAINPSSHTSTDQKRPVLGLGAYAPDAEYSCTADTLTYTSLIGKMRFTRE